MKYDVAIIGCGITGASIAFELSKYDMNVCIIESENDVATKTTKANSGIVHAGYDPKPGTLMAKLNKEGSENYEALAKLLNVHYNKIGSLVIGRKSENKELIDELYNRGIKNGIKGLSIVEKEELKKLEPNLCDGIDYALYAKTAAVVSPWEMCIALADNAVLNGAKIYLSTKVLDINKTNDGFEIITNNETINSTYIINASGVNADDIYKLALKQNSDKSFEIEPIKGEYYLLDKEEGKLVDRVVFQTPTKLGKGVLVSKTVHGNLIVGPNAFITDDKTSVSTTSDALTFIRNAASLTTNKINYRSNIRNFSGLRASVKGVDDFIIGESSYVKGFINFAGIKSPGLSCAPAFGPYAVKILQDIGFKRDLKKDFKIMPLNIFFKDLTQEEINNKIKNNPLYGRIICRCETVSEGEIVDAINRPITPRSVDAIKRRCNAGMGRCQGGFCGPKVLEILARELKCSPLDILQDKDGSFILKEYTKGGKPNE